MAAFLRRWAPACLEEAVGLRAEVVDGVQAELGIRLPRLYVEMILDAGAGSGAYRPFGPQLDGGFEALVSLHPPQMYPYQRYFKVARSVDPSLIDPEEVFIDLTRSDGHDAPLVTIDQAGRFQEHHLRDLHETLGECLARNAFVPFAILERKHQADVFVFPECQEEWVVARQKAHKTILSRGYAQALPMTPGFAGFCAKHGAASVGSLDGDTLLIRFAGECEEDTSEDVQRVLDAIPGAERAPN